jgi:hypothetical protein
VRSYHCRSYGAGAGPSNNPSKLVSPLDDLKGSGQPQRAVYPQKPVTFDKKYLGKEVPNSKTYYKRPEVQENEKKNEN